MRVRALGRPWPGTHWSADENAVLELFAARLTRGEFPTVPAAGRACTAELARRHHESQRRQPNPTPPPRTLPAVEGKLSSLLLTRRRAPKGAAVRTGASDQR
jgi:hypothetical protein